MISSRSTSSLHSNTRISPPPTNRLWLKIPNASKSRRVIDGESITNMMTTPQSSIQQQTTNNTVINNSSPIRPLVLQRSQMSPEKWKKLQIQTKVLEQLDMRTADSNKRATYILSMFRACNPDEFGLIHLHTFQPYFSQNFGLTAFEATEMFNIGDVAKNNELDYANFRSIFVSIDTDYKALIAPLKKGGLRKIQAPGTMDNTGESGGHQSEHSIVQGMTKEDRIRYLQHKRVQTLIDQKLRFLENCFIVKEPVTITMKESLVRVKLTFAELYEAFDKLEMNMEGLNEQILYDMFGKINDNQQHYYQHNQHNQKNISFSELIKANDLYFSLLGSSMEAIENKRQYTKLHDVYGRRLGRRKVGSGPAASGHLSQPGFLAHDDGRLGISSPDSIDQITSSSLLFSSQSTPNLLQSSHSNVNHPLNTGVSSVSGIGARPRIQHSWKDPSVVAGLATRTNSPGMFVPLAHTGCMPRYDEAFNDPVKHLWEQRWYDKCCPDRKRKLAKKALLGNNELAQKQNHDMFSRLTFNPQGVNSQQKPQPSVVDANSRPWATGMNWS